jgi:Ca2+-binding EF-hand superfamily protein
MKQFDFNTTETDIANIIKKIDKDGNGTIELEEFLDFIARYFLLSLSKVGDSSDTSADLKKMFKIFDQDGNGLITREELRDGLKKLGEAISEKDLD